MAFPQDCVSPLCDSFLRRAERLLISQDISLSAIHYSVLTLKLLAEKNDQALRHLTITLSGPRSQFLASAYECVLRGLPASQELSEVLCDFSSVVFRCISTLNQGIFENKIAVKSSLASLKSLLMEDTLEKVPHAVIHQLIRTLFHFSSRWSLQSADFCCTSLAIIMKLLQKACLKPVTGIFAKAVANELFSSLSKSLDDRLMITSEEAAIFSCLSTSQSHGFICTNEALLVLDYLILCEGNKQVLLAENVTDFLSPLIDNSSYQERAAELLCALLSSNSPGSQVSLDVEKLITTYFEHSLDTSGAQRTMEKDGGADVFTVLISCAVKCFLSFISSCGAYSSSDASLNLMYTSTLVKMMLDVFGQEVEDDQMKLADSISVIPKAPETFVHMLWGSSIVTESKLSDLPSPLWVSTFFEIWNLLILCTHYSEQFCLSLCEAGIAHFMECEMEKMANISTTIENYEIQRARLLSLLTILYNCVQKKQCLDLFVNARHLSTYLASIALFPDLEIRIPSKFILGYLKINLEMELQQEILTIQPDETIHILSSLHKLTTGENDNNTIEELLKNILKFSVFKQNLSMITNPLLLKIFDSLLSGEESTYHDLILQIIWNLLTSDVESRKSLIVNVPAIRTMSTSSDIKALHHCVSTLIDQEEEPMNGWFELLAYAGCCFQYCRYKECITTVDRLLNACESDRSTTNEAKLLKAKALFFRYRKMQHIFLQSRGEEAIKGVELFKQECYKYAKEAILLLGAAQDHDFLDKEGSRLLDFAMIDYLRETNDLGHCQRCLLCRRKVKLKRSHVYPKSILKDIAADLISGKDHKVFSTMIGKMVKKSAGEATYGMLCGQCEQCLSQNGENQFSEQVHHKICVKREVVKDELRLTYGSWLYDFCVGILFRSIAVSTVFIEFERSISDLYEMFCFCRKHLLSLTTNVSSLKPQQSKPLPTVGEQTLAPDQPLRICFFVNPTISSSCRLNLEYVLKAPATFINPVSLCEGIYSHDRRMSTVLVHFDHMNILFQSQTNPNLVMHEYIVHPHGGMLILPKEYKRWQAVPTGVWKLFSAIAQASANLSNLQVKSADGGGKEESNIVTKLNLVYSPENIIGLNQSRVFSLLPLSYKQQLDSSNRVAITFPADHRVLVKATRQWNYQQEITLFVAETFHHFLCLVFIISVPGWHIIDGLFLDMYSPTVKLPFLNGKTEECHPLECSVIQGMMEEVREIPDYIQIKTQLS